MKASQYIKELKKLIDEYGDCEVCDQQWDNDAKEYRTYPAKPDFWHRARISNIGTKKPESFIMNCFGSVPEEE